MDKKRILLIDDDVCATRILKKGLELTGAYEVHEENSGPAGLHAAHQFRPDLILLDVMMPGMDGGDVASRISRDKNLKNTPIVFLTSLVSEREAGESSFVSGGYPFIAKPITATRLAQFIDQCLAAVTRPAVSAA